MSNSTTDHGSIEFQKELLGEQKKSVYLLAKLSVLMLVILWFFPTFFIYPYLSWGGIESVQRFWPAFAWAGIGTAIITLLTRSRLHARDISALGYGLLTSTIAGIWEEIGFRWVFICYAMISIIVVNWIWGAGIGWLAGVIFLVLTIILAVDRNPLAIATALVVWGAVWFAQNANIIYWFYENVLVPVIHYTTFCQMDPVLYGGAEKMFLFGAILANARFRNAHIYQGLLGIVNSWYMGMVLLYATVTYGLLTAIAVHIIYDVICSTACFTFRRAAN